MAERDFKDLLRSVRCWDADVERFYQENKQPIVDCALQNKDELTALCEWIEQEQIKSYLEVGCWTGRMVNALQELFRFTPCAACDLGIARSFELPVGVDPGILFFEGNARSPIYENWRMKLGMIDLTFISTDYNYEGVKRDFEIHRAAPHRFIALHGISGGPRVGPGVKRLWDELDGNKHEILLPHPAIGSEEPTLGIGIWSAK